MSEIMIKDGGGGDVATVGDFKRLHVQSESWAEEAIASARGGSYIFHASCHLSANTNGGLLYIKNTGSALSIAVTQIYFDAHVLANPIMITQVKEPATVSGGTNLTNSTSDGIVQKNFGEPNTARAISEFFVSDGASDITYAGGQVFHRFAMSSLQSQQRNMRATNVIAPDTTWLLGWETADGTNATDGQTIGISINTIIYDPKNID